MAGTLRSPEAPVAPPPEAGGVPVELLPTEPPLHGKPRSWLLLVLGVLLPLCLFGVLAAAVQGAYALPFDGPVLMAAHGLDVPGLESMLLVFTAAGYAWGVIPVDVLLVLALAWLRRFRESLFALAALGGAALLNIAAKQAFARTRPALWDSIAPELTYSFPSAHAMGSMALATVLVLLAWRTRWRWPVLAAMAVFVAMVGLSRVYLGVHFPSDVVAGWSAALAWVTACHAVLFHRHAPWEARHAATR